MRSRADPCVHRAARAGSTASPFATQCTTSVSSGGWASGRSEWSSSARAVPASLRVVTGVPSSDHGSDHARVSTANASSLPSAALRSSRCAKSNSSRSTCPNRGSAPGSRSASRHRRRSQSSGRNSERALRESRDRRGAAGPHSGMVVRPVTFSGSCHTGCSLPVATSETRVKSTEVERRTSWSHQTLTPPKLWG